AGPPPLSREDVLRALASELESQASASDSPVGALIRLAALELVSGASAGAAPEASNLTPREKQFLESWRELIGAARENLKHESDVRPLADKVVELAERLRAEESIAVADARLCTRIDGFGMFNELSRRDAGGPYVFTAGKPVLFLIYTELVNHAHAPTTRGGAEGFLVSLSQELTLTHASSSGESVVWRRGFEGVSEFSRKKRRDFYTTERVSLPATLGVGAYRLKVSVRDETSGAVAEAVIPIEFVAAGSAPR
ncbi:MAG: hypothetical protein SFZ24_00750, partial [Planctomycetota bacterium]|nr:hypothetical protein [Planctomycetota bacterium]